MTRSGRQRVLQSERWTCSRLSAFHVFLVTSVRGFFAAAVWTKMKTESENCDALDGRCMAAVFACAAVCISASDYRWPSALGNYIIALMPSASRRFPSQC
ncbi:hypothetical protein EJ06DRAFT_317335 [Trichodelitschia bisporula]|uniref:Uncharacterized protein n=1 Tax=Trichodelitschia bisporula TaxID=703511 RepID=A0A6G1I4G8_9PEZI|nr:hypothetical protein EJ06DRAFT_317335 [Trichodelitschia bisporula]